MLLGLGTFSELPFGDPNNAQIHNIEFAETGNVSSYEVTFSTGSETVTGGANVSPDGSSASFTIGDETAFGEAFQNLITFSTGDLALTIWNETDDSETSTWTLVDPGSTD